jgi:DNA invertase Pin-like site-specific DNA recombinase
MKKVISTDMADRIARMRARGIGYRRIAKDLGLKADSVKKHCKRKGIGGYHGGMDRTHGIYIVD